MLANQSSPEWIESLECFPVVLPLKHPLIMSTYRIDSAESLFLRLRTRDGVEGWGEAAPNAVMTGETLVSMAAAVERWVSPIVVGRSLRGCRRFVGNALKTLYGNGSVKAAIDMALLDLEGRSLGVPAIDLLGGPCRDHADVMRLIDLKHAGPEGFAELVTNAARMRSDGCKAFKLKVGVASSIDVDVEALKHLRRELGPDALIGADANMGWDLAAARRFAARVASLDLAFLEQPLPLEAVADMARLQADASFPISADEMIQKIPDILRLNAARAIEGVSLKANKVGGPTELLRVATVCDALALRVNLAMLLESSLSCAAMAHVACAVPRLDWGVVLGNAYLEVDPVLVPLEASNGVISPPLSTGLGVEVDVGLLKRFAASAS